MNNHVTCSKLHFLNTVRHFPEKYSCAIDSFLEGWIACIGNLQAVHNNNYNEFFNRMSSVSLLIFLQGNLYGYDQLEDAILEIDRVDVWYDNRRVIQNLKHHDDSQDV